MKKVLLIVPPTGLFIREDRCQTPIKNLKTVALRPPIDLLYAAAGFKQGGAECRLEDYPAIHKSWDALEHDLKTFQPDLLVLSITTPSLDEDLQAATLAKKVNSQIVTVAKGAHFNVLDKITLEKYADLDITLKGEFEEACTELAQGLPYSEIRGITFRNTNGQIIQTPLRGFIKNLDTIPFPARHLIKNELYIRPDTLEPQTTIVTNRGCPFSCTYCLANQVSGTINRLRSPENVVGELKECVEKYGIHNFLFRSDLFTATPKWVKSLCDLIRAENLIIKWACNSRVDTISEELLSAMKQAGCWLIAYGVESGDQKALDQMKKKAKVEDAGKAIRLTQQAGIRVSIYLLFGFPWDTPQTLQENINFGKKLNPDFLEIFYIYPFPGTEMYQEIVRLGLLKDGEIPKQAYGEPAFPTQLMTVGELAKWRNKALRQFYLRPAYMIKTLGRIRSFREVISYIKYGFLQLLDMMKSK